MKQLVLLHWEVIGADFGLRHLFFVELTT